MRKGTKPSTTATTTTTTPYRPQKNREFHNSNRKIFQANQASMRTLDKMIRYFTFNKISEIYVTRAYTHYSIGVVSVFNAVVGYQCFIHSVMAQALVKDKIQKTMLGI